MLKRLGSGMRDKVCGTVSTGGERCSQLPQHRVVDLPVGGRCWSSDDTTQMFLQHIMLSPTLLQRTQLSLSPEVLSTHRNSLQTTR